MLNRWRNVGLASVQPARIADAIASAWARASRPRQHPAPRVAAIEDEAADPLGMPRGVDERDGSALRHPEQREPVNARGVDDGLEVGDPGLHRELAELVVGEPAPSLVVADERVAVTQLGQPVTPYRALPVEVEMRQPRRRPHDRRPAAMDRVCQPHAVASGAEANLLRHEVDLTRDTQGVEPGSRECGRAVALANFSTSLGSPVDMPAPIVVCLPQDDPTPAAASNRGGST